jgi:hypothetical protein
MKSGFLFKAGKRDHNQQKVFISFRVWFSGTFLTVTKREE